MVDLDALRRDYSQFLRPDRVLLTGHSHQAWPDVAREAGARAFDDAARLVDDKWGQAVFPLIGRVQRRLLDRMGVPDGDGLTFGSNTHELVFRLLSCLRASDRPRVVTTGGEFHSLRRQLGRLEEEGFEVVWVDSHPRATLAERLLEAITPGTAMVAVSAVFFEDSWVLREVGAVIERAVAVGAIPLIDIYHAFNVVPLDWGPAAEHAFVTAGGYKYAEFGEGICWLRVPSGSTLRPVQTGWFADYGALERGYGQGPIGYGPGADRFAGATFDPTAFYRADAVLDLFDRHGLDVPTLRAISLRQTALIVDVLGPDASRLASSPDASRRGGFVALRVPGADHLVARLRARGVWVDARQDLLRLGPAPYLTDDEIVRAVGVIREELRALIVPSARNVSTAAGALLAVALASAGAWKLWTRWHLPPPSPAVVDPWLSCGGERWRLDGAELAVQQGAASVPRLVLAEAAGVTLRCEGDSLRLGRAGGALTLAAAGGTTLRFVPGGAPAAGEQAAPFAVVAWGERAIGLGAGRFAWREFPERFEARWGAGEEATLWPASTRTAVGQGWQRGGGAVGRITGRLEAAGERRLEGAVVVALDASGRLAAAATAGPGGEFALESAASMESIYTAAGSSRVGPAVRATDGVVLPAPGVGALRLTVRDHDTGEPLPARLVVHGHDGTREPNLGSPERGTAGPLVDASEDGARLALPAGRYRVLATRGPEYTVDEAVVEVGAAAEASRELRLRRVVPTPGWASCDLHVHARGSFDSLVSIDDRVGSLMAAGVDLAAASEHNRTGSYDASLMAGQGKWFTWIPAIEVTTVDPLRGHFNVIPYALPEAPRYRRTSLRALIDHVRTSSPGSLVQVNHPRMGNIGHFNDIHLDERTEQGLEQLARGFDLLEIYNGFDLGETAKVEAMLAEWLRLIERGRLHWATGNSDSHAVQYIGAGYPRTYVALAADHDGGAGSALDVGGLVEGLRQGHALTTSGPMVEVSQGERGPGDALSVTGGQARVRVRVRAAPWVDASELTVYVGGREAVKRELPAGPTPWQGPPVGTLAEERARAVRFDDELTVAVAPGDRALVVVVRGRRKVGEVLPFMDWLPMAIVNPMRIETR